MNAIKKVFSDMSLHQKVFSIALPMMLSNISVPLLGLVDTAVIGHLPESYYLAGVAVGSMVITLTFWLLVFLRMSTTGLVAQAFGENNPSKILSLLLQSSFIAFILGCLILILQKPISLFAFSFVEGGDQVLFYAKQYFDIRIWSAPAALINMVLLGWLLGMQSGKMPMILLLVANLVNIALDVLFVVVFKWGVSGVAFASVCADYVSLFVGIMIVYKMLTKSGSIPSLSVPFKKLISLSSLAPFLLLNRDIFIRSLCLQLTFAFMTIQGTKLGTDIVSTNAVLMQFLMLIAFSMDGLAYAIGALVGKNIGARNLKALKSSLSVTLFWGLIFSLLQVLFFYIGGDWIISQVTSIESIQRQAHIYLPWLILIPLTSMLGFIFDGVFIGMTRGKVMRNSMLFSVIIIYFPVWWITTMLLPENASNHALWIAMNAFMLARGLSLSWIYFKLNKNKQLLI